MVWDKPSRLPDQLPDNGRAEVCTDPDTPGRLVSVDGQPGRDRAGGRLHGSRVRRRRLNSPSRIRSWSK